MSRLEGRELVPRWEGKKRGVGGLVGMDLKAISFKNDMNRQPKERERADLCDHYPERVRDLVCA